jgi:cytochrome oxidase Cu insertion factor (SCO1/SenC/PrrC family)
MTRAAPVLPPAAGQAGDGPGPPRRWARRRVITAAVCAMVLAAGLLTFLVIRHRDQQNSAGIRPSGIPASISTPLASLMELSPVPGRPAPAFTLTDQDGHTLSLTSFKGHAVVLEFMDPHCTDICPIVSQEFIDAYHDLGKAAPRAVFIAVNVNPYFNDVSDVAAYSSEQQLKTIPSWHFLTGPLASLRAVWNAYGIQVDAPSRNADVIHTSQVLFIDPAGRERYIASPMADHTSKGKAYLPAAPLTAWGRGIALVTRQLAA